MLENEYPHVSDLCVSKQIQNMFSKLITCCFAFVNNIASEITFANGHSISYKISRCICTGHLWVAKDPKRLQEDIADVHALLNLLWDTSKTRPDTTKRGF